MAGAVSVEGSIPPELFIDGRGWQVGPSFQGWLLEAGFHCVSTSDCIGFIFCLKNGETMGLKFVDEIIEMVPFKPANLPMVRTDESWREKTEFITTVKSGFYHHYADLTFSTKVTLKASLDRSELLAEHGAGRLLGELQLTWILFSRFGHFEAFLHWRSLVKLLNTSFSYWRQHDAREYFHIIQRQLEEFNLAEEVPEYLEIAREFHELCDEVGEVDFKEFLDSVGLVHLPDPEEMPVII